MGGSEQRLAGGGLQQFEFAAGPAQGMLQVGLDFLAAQAVEVVAHHDALGEGLVMGQFQPPQLALADQQQAQRASRIEAGLRSRSRLRA